MPLGFNTIGETATAEVGVSPIVLPDTPSVTPRGLTITPTLGLTSVLVPPNDVINLLKIFSVPSTPYVIQRQYWTDVIMSRAGKEQRRANRIHPRRHIEFTTTIQGDRWLDFARLLTYGQRRPILIADESRRVKLIADSVADVLTVASMPNWVTEDMYLVIADFVGKSYGFAKVRAVVTNTISISGIFSQAWPAGSYAYAATIGYLQPGLSYDSVWSKVATPKIVFDEDPQYYITESTRDALGTFNGREVWTFPPNQFEPVSMQNDPLMEMVDFGFSRLEAFDIWERTHRLFKASWSMREDNADLIRAMFDRMRGQQGEFYMPTFEQDIPIIAQANAGTKTLTVAGTTFFDLYNGSTLYKAVCVFFDDARIPTVQYNRVTAMAKSSGNTVLTCADNWTSNVTVGLKISWLPVWRFATDMLVQTWVRGFNDQVVVNVQMPMRQLEDLIVETDTP